MRPQVQEQPGHPEAPLEYKGRHVLDPILLDCTHLFGALEAGAFELANARMHQTLGTNTSFLTQDIVNTL